MIPEQLDEKAIAELEAQAVVAPGFGLDDGGLDPRDINQVPVGARFNLANADPTSATSAATSTVLLASTITISADATVNAQVSYIVDRGERIERLAIDCGRLDHGALRRQVSRDEAHRARQPARRRAGAGRHRDSGLRYSERVNWDRMLQLGVQLLDRFAHHRFEQHRQLLHAHLATENCRHIEQVIDEPHHPFALALRLGQEVGVHRVELRAFLREHELERSLNPGERAAEVVHDLRGEVVDAIEALPQESE